MIGSHWSMGLRLSPRLARIVLARVAVVVSLLLGLTVQVALAEDGEVTNALEVSLEFNDWDLGFDRPHNWDESFSGWKIAMRWFWWRAGAVLVLEYDSLPDAKPEIHPATALSVFGLHAGSGYRAERIWNTMLAVMDLIGCREELERFAHGADRVARGVLDVHRAECDRFNRDRDWIETVYTLTLEVDRSLWVLTVEPVESCCKESDRIRQLVDEPLDSAYRTFRTAFDGL